MGLRGWGCGRGVREETGPGGELKMHRNQKEKGQGGTRLTLFPGVGRALGLKTQDLPEGSERSRDSGLWLSYRHEGVCRTLPDPSFTLSTPALLPLPAPKNETAQD